MSVSASHYSREYILDLWKEFELKLLVRENEWDIKISDYIFSHYKEEKLFTNLWHISTNLAREIANRILEKLNYIRLKDVSIQGLDEYEVYIYEDVKKALGLEFDEKNIRNSSKLACIDKSELNLKAYIDTQLKISSFEKWSKKNKE